MITLGFIGTLIAKKMLINEKSKTPDSPFYKILLKITFKKQFNYFLSSYIINNIQKFKKNN